MSVASALSFLRACRTDAELRACVRALPSFSDTERLLHCAPGYDFTAAELEQAFRLDWAARWFHYHRE